MTWKHTERMGCVEGTLTHEILIHAFNLGLEDGRRHHIKNSDIFILEI